MNKLYNKPIDEVMCDKYLSYAISTIISRSLPDIRDGLKPVHRRIIYSMYQLKLFNGYPFKKCARIVGDVMGKFHPHGDQAIYDSLVRLAQEFSTRAPLIEGQGNFGNIDGDNAAAMRYTEARLDSLSNYFFDGIEENSINFKENYDGQNLEPVVLPTKLPNILMNGASGIAVGMATNIPPHNIFELNKCIIKIIKNPDTNLLSLFKYLSGPDLPTGGEISITSENQKEIYKKGKGSFIINSKYNIENIKKGLYQIVITEIPYQVNKTRLIEQLANLINNKKIPLDDVFDESDEKIRIVLKPKNRNIDSSKLIKLCFKLSDLSIRYSCNFNVLVNGSSPKQLGLKEILKNFIDFRFLTIKRKATFNIDKIKKRLEILEGFLIAYKFLDFIIKIIRTNDNPKKEIMKKYKLTENQSEAILNMRLGSLKKLDELETKKDINKLNENLNFLNKLIKNKKFLNEYLINEIEQTSKELNISKYFRRTKIIIEEENNNEISFEEFIEVEKLTITVNKDGLIKSYKDHLDISKLFSNQKDLMDAYHIISNQKLLIFSSSGRVFTIDPNLLPSGKSNAKNFIYYVDSNMSDKLVKLIPYSNNLKCILASLKGKGFISDLNNILTIQKKGKQLFNLKNNDQLIRVIKSDKSHLACVNNDGKLLIFNAKDLPILQRGGGVQLQKIKNNNFLTDIQNFNLGEGISWKTGSLNKNNKEIDFWLGKRAQSGKKVPKRFNKNLKFYD
jgi:topoisomerase-4 subunit A